MSTNTKAFIGIDAGTTGCTVMIFDEKGNALRHGYKEYPSESPYAGQRKATRTGIPCNRDEERYPSHQKSSPCIRWSPHQCQ